jgi:hypothetical protein
MRRLICTTLLTLTLAIGSTTAASPGLSAIRTDDLKEWLTYVASDELQGRGDYSPGLGLAAAYIRQHLQAWGVTPAGDPGSYLQTVRVIGVHSTSHSSVTVQVGGETRTFKDGDGVTFPREAGGKQTASIDRVEFAGYGLDVASVNHLDFGGRSVEGQAIVWLGARGPKETEGQNYRLVVAGRSRHIVEELKAGAAIGPEPLPREGRGGQSGRAGTSASTPQADFTTTERLDTLRRPTVTASDAFFSFLFSRAPVKYEELKRRADAQDSLPSFRLEDVKIVFNVSNEYTVVRTQLLQNVVGIVEGSDPRLKGTYVAFGAHYDHVGYAEGEPTDGARQPPPFGLRGSGAPDDRIWNGADDDGSGTVALMELAKTFAAGPRPKRSLLFVWHAGEEIGTYGSRYFADYPTVPIDSIVAQLNIDMIGRNRDDKASEANNVYLVGSDRISSELDQVAREANRALPRPMTLDYELNDPSDPQQFYYRSDHHSYAAKGIPVIFFTTGLHPDYHRNTDEVSKILFDKLTRVTELVYETGVRLGDLDHPPMRDNKGPRAGKAAK